MKTRISFVLLTVVAAVFLCITPAIANQVNVYSVDDPSQDPINIQGLYDEIGDIIPTGPFPVDEGLVSLWTDTDYRPCTQNDDLANIPNILVTMTNLTGRDLDDVYYVADPETTLQNYDGHIGNVGLADATLAFRIDSIGLNTPLISESMISDNIWQAGEIWQFVIQDFVSGWGGPPAPFNSLGIASQSSGSPSTGSIIAVPEPSTLTLLCCVCSAFGGIAILRRRK